MTYSSSPIENLIPNHREMFVAKCVQHYIRSLHIFGSALTDAFCPKSDIDLFYQVDLKKFEKRDNPEVYDYTDNLLSFEKALITFFDRKIDLIPDVFISNKYLQEEIEKTKQQIYAA